VRILFVNPGAYLNLPRAIGGASLDTHYLALTLGAMGHEVAVAAAFPRMDTSAGIHQVPYRLRQLAARRHLIVYADDGNGYDTFRVGNWLMTRLLEERIRNWRPDAVVVQGYEAWNLALVAMAHHQPVVLRHVDKFGVDGFASAIRADPRVAAMLIDPLFAMACNSKFVAAELRQQCGLAPPVIYPPVQPADTGAPAGTAGCVTFVSPIPQKGLSVALRVAALLPQQEFLFINGWSTRRQARQSLARELELLPNVTLRPSSFGLGDVFRSTAVVLMPSQVQEAFGRVIVEAGHSGIPAIASRVGGIPEAIGESGVLLEASSPPESWAGAISDALIDPARYARLSAAALTNARREEFKPEAIAAEFLSFLEGHIIHAETSPN
jgi:glycosyltransferase involved in cell wall biosynthesis